uniref:Nestin n=1 Tax=Castor canadensis TaxID=51338 RepID=A0A8C0ZWB5_CASCN
MEGCMGEESFQMWELNRRLEAYLARVKALEEQNELLSAELGGLRAQSGDASWRARADDELAALRALVDQRWREKHAAEVERDNLAEELEGVAGRCQQLRLARERTAEEAARSRRAVETEKCAQGWLSTQAAELERELEALRVAHEEELASLNAQAACAPRCPAPPRGLPAPAPEVEELARRLGEAWRGAVRGYQERVAHMETSLGQARERLGRAVQGAREGRLELQQLQAERSGLQERRAALEQRLEGRWQERLRATEKFQLAVEALEQEKQGLQSQIAQVLEGRQQLAHLKMSLSLEVATYRTLLEAENSRLQTPSGNSKASLGFQDSKLELHFPGTPEIRRLPVLSPTPLPSPLPNTLETPVPAFLKSQEFLQARTPALASTPIPPTPQTPCLAMNAEVRAQEAPLPLLQSQGERQQAPEPLGTEAKAGIPDSIIPGPEEPGGKQPGASAGQSPEDQVSSVPLLSPDHPSLEAKDEEPSTSRVSSIFQEKEGQIWGLVEKEATIEVKVASSLQKETWQEEGDLHVKEIQDSQGPLEKETLKSLGEEIQEPLMSLENQKREVEAERTLEKDLEEENQELLWSLEEKDVEAEKPLEKEASELPKPVENEDPQILRSLEKENQELMMSPEGNLETVLLLGKENQELVKSLEEENLESLRSLTSLKDENQEILRPLEKENQEPLKSLEEEDQKIEILRPLEKENQEPLKLLEEEDQKIVKPLEKENQEPLKLLEEEDQRITRPVENQEPLRSLEEEDQQIFSSLEQETQHPLRALGEDQMTLRPLENTNSEPLTYLGKDQETVESLEKENQELFKSLKEESVESVRSLETENLKSLKTAEEENLETLKPLEGQEPLWSLEEMNRETMKPLEKEIKETLRSGDENQETLSPLEKDNQEPLSSLDEWNLETLRSPVGAEKENQRDVEEEEKILEKGENQESLRSLEEEGEEQPQSVNQPRWEDMEVKDQDLGQELPTGRDGMENEDESKLDLRKQDGKEKAAEQGELQLNSMGESWDPGNPESKEWRVPVVGASGKESTEGLQDRERQPEQVEAPDFPASQGEPEVIEPLLKDEDAVPGGDHDSLEMTLGSETDRSKSAVGAEVELKQEVTEVGLEDPGHPAREKVVQPFMGEESLEAKRAQGLEGPGKSLEEADASEVMFPGPPKVSRDPVEPPRDWKKPEPTVPWGAEVFSAETPGHDGSDVPQASPSGQEEDEGEPWPPSPILEDVPGPQLQVEGNQEPSWGPEVMAEVLGNGEGEQEEFGPGEIPESLQEEGEESREESEADELGETLPDSTPLGLYLRSPASPRLDLAGEQRPSPQGEAGMEDWDPAVLTSKGLGAPPSEDEEDGEEEQGPDSDLSEDFEDLGTEASLLPGVSREVAEPLGQVPQLLEPTGWDRDGESDGFADEEESGEEEEREPGVQQWESGSSVGSLQTLSSSQRGDLLEPGAVGVNVPWDDGLRGTMADAPVTALDTESQDSAEPSGSEEESDSVPLEKEDQIPGSLETLRGVEDMGPGAEDIFSINGQAPNLEESEHMSGRVVNGLEQSKEVGNGTQAALDGNQGLPLQEEEGGARKTPWAGAPVHLGPGRFLKFTPRETDGDSLSSGED